ncbi:hypothetical protein EKN06_04305 [Croceicoccus ponticola]|uniref:Uncharacterized protein n=1 Tax=Croceicoccus ponticola TaxID=2217664 RepID=A0A437H1A5_9SPHN|nr:hypothetical protein [Croceicoccus ponticola]RVQ69410.1 hypothetical protein EKN06_04305 [Croceicoccus ponticola]
MAIACIFLHVLSDLGFHQRVFAVELALSAALSEMLVYSLPLAGLAFFYGLKREVKRSRP